ncbi:selenide, water dikinase SelD [Zooshikella harenae]|uniref:Selenide, water dikinase SelD n=1 Tax=Zooshikella harenae TaxID=2827238 RepID=A0ABS5Z8P0_9GAMM|nr:selenide, water dikinase SelD [Zooshikella harenae]MBU2710148.1 selenide, water dikinase SelD [Zooshikella harenae]
MGGRKSAKRIKDFDLLRKGIVISLNTPQTVYAKDIVLVGGGHSHVLFIRRWKMKPLPDTRLTLISPQVYTPYSGMLPGLIAEHYTFEQTHIDLRRLCQWAGVRFIQDRVVDIEPDTQHLSLKNYPQLNYDVLSLDIGLTPDLSIPGATEHTIPVKPISDFFAQWQSLKQRVTEDKQSHYTIGIVGGGAGSIELALAISYSLKSVNAHYTIHLFTASAHILPDYLPKTRQHVRHKLFQAHVNIHENFKVSNVCSHGIYNQNNEEVLLDKIFWCTHGQGADWLKNTLLDISEQGFVLVKNTLQALKFDNIFAAGDIAHLTPEANPKAGVYAVRMAPILFHNICALLANRSLKLFKPQKHFLSLLACGEKDAIGERVPFSFHGPWVWRWKDFLDRQFIEAFQQLSLAEMSSLTKFYRFKNSSPVMRCDGCGAKISQDILAETLETIGVNYQAEDAAVIPWREAKFLLQTVDQLRAFIDDPWLFGRIAIVHALSDIYAMGGKPHSVQVAITLPYQQQNCLKRELLLLMQGIQYELDEAECALVGGHTAEGAELSVAITANGRRGLGKLWQKTGAKPGDVLILTKPLSTGVILAANKAAQAKGNWVEEMLAMMLLSNRAAVPIVKKFQPHAVTDITGFGLLGHLLEMLKPEQLSAELDLGQLPVLEGATDLFRHGWQSTLQAANENSRHYLHKANQWLKEAHYPLLFDPQTSGGLLVAVSEDVAYDCLNGLQIDYPQAAIVGKILPKEEQTTTTVYLKK